MRDYFSTKKVIYLTGLESYRQQLEKMIIQNRYFAMADQAPPQLEP